MMIKLTSKAHGSPVYISSNNIALIEANTNVHGGRDGSVVVVQAAPTQALHVVVAETPDEIGRLLHLKSAQSEQDAIAMTPPFYPPGTC